MKSFISILVLALALAVSSSAHAGAWQKNSDTGGGTPLAPNSPVGKNTANQRLYYFIAATTSADSDAFEVQHGTVSVTLNSNVAAPAGDNVIRVNLMRRISEFSSLDVNNSIIMEGVSFTGDGVTAIMWEVPVGFYWIDIVTPTVTGDSLVVVERGIDPSGS